jgi:YidC/Oxa1 family membrane protein insertase
VITAALRALPLLGENSLFHLIGQIFHPVFVVVGTVLAAIYGVIPNYAVAIVFLTILIMALLTPLTVKSTKSMIAMQRIQPEITRLRQKYKGPENREQLNQELMRVYKEQGVNPAGSCLPMFLQMPFLIVLYDVIRGLSNTVTRNHHLIVSPRYIPTNSQMYHDLVNSHGAMKSFGVNLTLKPFSHHANWYGYIPFFALVAGAVVLQYVQMSQMNRRNPGAMQANPQMQKMQKVMPIFFAYIYFLIPAAVVIYMLVSTVIRIATQDVLFRTGMVQPAGERAIPASGSPPGGGRGRGAIAAKSSFTDPSAKSGPGDRAGGQGSGQKGGKPPAAKPPADQSGGTTGGGSARRPGPSGTGSRRTGRPTSNGSGGRGSSTDGATAPKPHPRAKGKRTRKAR